MSETREQAFEERFTLFFDFLGSSEAAAGWPRERVHEFVDLLISIGQGESVEAIDGKTQPDGGYKFSITPEITTFSDNIVVSWRGVSDDETGKMLDSVWAGVICQDAIRVLSSVAEMALRIG